jgi:hypothetical protein
MRDCGSKHSLAQPRPGVRSAAAACFSLAEFRQKENFKILKFGHIVSCGGREGSIVRTEKKYTYIVKIARISRFDFQSVAIFIES